MDKSTALPMIRTRELGKTYGRFRALSDCSLAIENGEVFGLLGPNGAGKTTLIRMLLGLLKPSSGTAIVAGYDCQRESLEVRRRTAYLPGEARLFRTHTGWAVARFFQHLRKQDDRASIARLAAELDLDLDRRVAHMSTGMRQKLALLVAFAPRVPLYILDEPTSNLDPSVRRTVLEWVRARRAAGATVLFSSHVLSEVEQVCDRVAILKDGRLARVCVLAELQRRHRIRLKTARKADLPPLPPKWQSSVTMRRFGDDVVLETAMDLAPLLGWLASLAPRELRVEPLGLQAVYDEVHPPEDAGHP